MKTVERVIHFYEIGFANEEKPLYKDILKEVFQKIIAINNDSSKSRFNRANDYIIYTQDVIFIPRKK